MSQDFFRPLFEPRHFSRELFLAGRRAVSAWLWAIQRLSAATKNGRRPACATLHGGIDRSRLSPAGISRGRTFVDRPDAALQEWHRTDGSPSGGSGRSHPSTGVYQVYSVHHEWPQPGRVIARIWDCPAFRIGRRLSRSHPCIEQAVRRLAAARARIENAQVPARRHASAVV